MLFVNGRVDIWLTVIFGFGFAAVMTTVHWWDRYNESKPLADVRQATADAERRERALRWEAGHRRLALAQGGSSINGSVEGWQAERGGDRGGVLERRR